MSALAFWVSTGGAAFAQAPLERGRIIEQIVPEGLQPQAEPPGPGVVREDLDGGMDSFGGLVAVCDGLAAVFGYLGPDGSAYRARAVYFYRISDGSLAFTLSEPEPGELWGRSIAFNSRLILIGAPAGGDSGFGRVYVYVRGDVDPLVHDHVLVPDPDGDLPSIDFGDAVAISDGTSNGVFAVVGEPGKPSNEIGAKGALYFARFDVPADPASGTIVRVPTDPSSVLTVELGRAIDISDDGAWAVAGDTQSGGGAVAVFELRAQTDGGLVVTPEQTLRSTFLDPSGEELARGLGLSVEIHGDVIASGQVDSAEDPATSPEIGGVTLFERVSASDDFRQTTFVGAADAGLLVFPPFGTSTVTPFATGFGRQVEVGDGYVVIAADDALRFDPEFGDSAFEPGQVYLLLTGLSGQGSVASPVLGGVIRIGLDSTGSSSGFDGLAGDLLGFSLAADGSDILVGQPALDSFRRRAFVMTTDLLKLGDANQDGAVGLADFDAVLGGLEDVTDLRTGYVTGDGVTDLEDLNIVLGLFGG